MLKSTSFKELDLLFQNLFEENFATKCKILRELVSDSSKWEQFDLTRLRFPRIAQKDLNLILLACISWYFPEEIAVLLRLELEQRWSSSLKVEKEILLSSKMNALGYILVQDRWSDRDFHGNVVKIWKSSKNWFNLVSFQRRPGRAKRKVRHRGYRDKGSVRFSHQVVGFPQKKFRTQEDLETENAILIQQRVILLGRVISRLQEEGVS